MTRDARTIVALALLAALLLIAATLAYALATASEAQGARSEAREKSGTMKGETAAACGQLWPFDTYADRRLVWGTRRDCGIFRGWDAPERPGVNENAAALEQ
jgi:hypothetical protein